MVVTQLNRQKDFLLFACRLCWAVFVSLLFSYAFCIYRSEDYLVVFVNRLIDDAGTLSMLIDEGVEAAEAFDGLGGQAVGLGILSTPPLRGEPAEAVFIDQPPTIVLQGEIGAEFISNCLGLLHAEGHCGNLGSHMFSPLGVSFPI